MNDNQQPITVHTLAQVDYLNDAPGYLCAVKVASFPTGFPEASLWTFSGKQMAAALSAGDCRTIAAGLLEAADQIDAGFDQAITALIDDGLNR